MPAENDAADQLKSAAETTKSAASGAKGAFQTAQAIKTVAQVAATGAEATNPAGWAMLAVKLKPLADKINKIRSDIYKKGAAGAAAGIAYLIYLFGLKIIGALTGAAFGLITGAPLLLIPGYGPFLYIGWTGFWAYRGWNDPINTIHLATHPWEAITKPLAKVWHYASASIKGTSGTVAGSVSSTTTSAVSATGGFLTGAASTLWGGLVSAAGTIASGIGSVVGSLWGSLTGGLAFSASAVLTPVGAAIGAVAVGSTLVGITTAASFFTTATDQGGENTPKPPEQEYASTQKLVSAPNLSLGPGSYIQFRNDQLPQELKFDLSVKPVTKLTNVTCTDTASVVKKDGTIEPFPFVPQIFPSIPCPTDMDPANPPFNFSFNTTAPNDPRLNDAVILNKFTLTGQGVATVAGSSTDYFIPLRDPVLDATKSNALKQRALNDYPNNLINAACPGGLTCWDYVISQGSSSNINPTLLLAVWYEESHFSDVGNHFSCPVSTPRTHDGDGLSGSLGCFISQIIGSEPNTADGFIDAMNHFCGTGPYGTGTLCENNPNFLPVLKTAYEELGGVAQALPGSPGGAPVILTSNSIAAVRIGTPPVGCPASWPTSGTVTQGPEGYFSHGPGGYEAIDIGAPIGNPVYSTIQGTVVKSWTANGDTLDQRLGVAPSNCPGLGVVYFWHLSAIEVNDGDTVSVGQEIAKSGLNGTGPHLHYEFNEPFDRSFPINAPPYIPSFITRNCDEPSIPCNTTTTAP